MGLAGCRTGSSGRTYRRTGTGTITEPRPDPKTGPTSDDVLEWFPYMHSHRHWLYCLLSLYDEPISFGTEMYLSRANSVTVCSFSWWAGPDVPDVPAGRVWRPVVPYHIASYEHTTCTVLLLLVLVRQIQIENGFQFLCSYKQQKYWLNARTGLTGW